MAPCIMNYKTNLREESGVCWDLFPARLLNLVNIETDVLEKTTKITGPIKRVSGH